MKKFVRLVRVCAGLPVLAHTAWCVTEWQVGGGAITLSVSGGTTYDSNLQSSASGDSDVYFNLGPTLRYSKKDSLIVSEASLRLGAERYVDQDRFNGETYGVGYLVSLPAGDERSYGFAFRTGYESGSAADVSLNDRVKSDTFSANLSGEATLARANTIRADVNYTQTTRDKGSNQKSLDYGPSYSYKFSDGTTAGTSYRRRETESESAITNVRSLDQSSDNVSVYVSRPLYGDLTGRVSVGYRWLDRGEVENSLELEDSDGYTFGAGLTGQFLPKQYFPKTTGTFSISYEDADSPGLNDESTRRVVGNIALTWQARDTTSLRFGVSRSQGLTATDETSIDNSISLTVSQEIAHFINGNFDIGYTQSDFASSNRQDDRYTAGMGINYQINLSWSSGFNYRFVSSTSTIAPANYDRHTASLSATYAF